MLLIFCAIVYVLLIVFTFRSSCLRPSLNCGACTLSDITAPDARKLILSGQYSPNALQPFIGRLKIAYISPGYCCLFRSALLYIASLLAQPRMRSLTLGYISAWHPLGYNSAKVFLKALDSTWHLAMCKSGRYIPMLQLQTTSIFLN